MLIRVEPGADEPLYEQVASSVRAQLAAGVLQVGDKLPPARDVADGLGINLHTVLRAYQLLRDEHLIDLRRGRNAVVTEAAGTLGTLNADIVQLVDRARTAGITADALVSLVKETYR
ncbi:GntR family transcriptional regulator [Agromyces sp. H66]|uniref:GntR family transcriptional regulator n=1 Tax=Agromyces sp. H66 TaxID=2529859 RepID=UPI0010AA178D|nr:GntR family transcriptional regulator [Agromyces sp. H66]